MADGMQNYQGLVTDAITSDVIASITQAVHSLSDRSKKNRRTDDAA
jgi:hypothetical protein